MKTEVSKIRKSHKIELKPNNKQKTYFKKACGVSRHAYNWGLVRWGELYQENKSLPKEIQHKISWQSLKKEFNSIKSEQFPWTAEVTKYAAQQPFKHLGTAFSQFFKKTKSPSEKKLNYPKLKKKNKSTDSFYIGGDQVRVRGSKVWIPNLGLVRLKEQLRFNGKINSVTISRTADRWFASFQLDLDIITKTGNLTRNDSVGVDLGINTLVTTSDGRAFKSPEPLKRVLGKLKKQNRKLSRKITAAKKNKRELVESKNFQKQKIKVSKIHARISNIRKDAIHKITNYLVSSYDNIAIEDLNVSGMLKNQKLSRAISDMGFYELRRQLTYKSVEKEVNLVIVDRYFPSSKCCSNCGTIKKDLSLKDRVFSCECGLKINRDLNAAINLKNKIGRVPAEFTPVEITALQKSVNPVLVTSIVEAGNKPQKLRR